MGKQRILSSHASLRERLVDSIYALVDDENEWPNTLRALDTLLVQSDGHDPATGYSEEIMSLLPHVNRVSLLLERIDTLHLENSHAGKLLDHIPMGIVVISRDLDILSINKCAQKLFDHMQTRYSSTRLQFSDKQHHTEFKATVAKVASEKTQGASVRMGHLNLWVSLYGHQESGQLVVFLGHRTFSRNIHLPSLMAAYGLTQKEAKLTSELCNGFSSLEDAASSMAISIATARSHLKKVFAKTDTCRQADLIKMVLVNPVLALQREDKKNTETPGDKTLKLTRLASGRTISWAEYGDPKGRPVLFCHAITGCRLLTPPDHGVLKRNHLRLIVPDRAGYGLSTPTATDPMLQWLEDMRYFIPQICPGGCSIIGHSAGGAHAMALAETFPAMVDHLCLISSVAPLLESKDIQDILPINRMVIQLACSTRGAAKSFLKLAFQSAVKKPDNYFDLILNSVPDLDKEVFGNAMLKTLLLESFVETTRQGTDHLIEELLYLATEWSVDVEKIRCPISIWHGRQDKHAPFPLMQRFSKRLPPNAKKHWVDDAGHYMLFYQWASILENHPAPATGGSRQ